MIASGARLLVVGVALLWAASASAQGRKPPLPPGIDPGGVAVAILSTGIDYRIPDIARRLARDGEGQLIAWDLVDGDNLPFNAAAAETPVAWGGDGNALVKGIGRPGRRVVAVRIDTRQPASLARAVAFLVRTPARIVVVPMWSADAAEWAAFAMAARAAPDLLFIAAAGDEGRDIDSEPVWPAALGLANVLVVTARGQAGAAPAARPNSGKARIAAVIVGDGGGAAPETSRAAAVAAADTLAGCWAGLAQRYRGESLKKAFLAEAAKSLPGDEIPAIARCRG